MATAGPSQAAPNAEHALPHETTPKQRDQIRLVFQEEFRVPVDQKINVETTILYNALSTKRHADIDDQDDGSFHSEVLKNSIDLLQRFYRCAPLYLKVDSGHRQRNNNFFAKDIFCRTFCPDIDGFDNKDNPRAWLDVFHFFHAMKEIWDRSLFGGREVSEKERIAAMCYTHGDVTRKGPTSSRKGALLWELMGLTSKAVDKEGTKISETWCVEAAVRIGLWQKRLKEDKDSLFRLPIDDDWGNHTDDLLPERDEDAMKLFKDLETKLRNFYVKCKEQMPEQVTVLPVIENPRARTTTPEIINQEDGTRDQKDPEMIQRGGASERSTPEMDFPRMISREFIPRTTNRRYPILQRSSPQHTIPQNKILQSTSPQRSIPPTPSPRQAIPQKKAFPHRAYQQAASRNIIIEDPRRFTAPIDPTSISLDQAKELITNVLRANGQEPDWDPELPRMVIRANPYRR
ncbi:hypothetical protein J7T55_002086 [Diaporthe amygdali]|uniref:uncharacterized protein n=1 Tax=Phomopsis amygdali TaxID=1214568 RepID=UPI0022FE8B1A|nr:uncharacterized protein J7T55_002086 [Diaporthe amygdali]KAJ0108482.1 hypothetical protein J7T55_002086 [Diaporthe amygdali]